MNNNLFFVFFLLFSSFSCIEKQKVSEDLVIRQVYLNNMNDSNNQKLFILDYPDKELPEGTEKKLDSYICSQVDSNSFKKGNAFIVWVIKDDDNLRRHKSEVIAEISDSYNPISTDHYKFYRYLWQNGGFLYKENHSHDIVSFQMPCYNSILDSATKIELTNH